MALEAKWYAVLEGVLTTFRRVDYMMKFDFDATELVAEATVSAGCDECVFSYLKGERHRFVRPTCYRAQFCRIMDAGLLTW
jgi:hypothetical protein